jgi:F-type H+-transporting ATPase subunit alpha
MQLKRGQILVEILKQGKGVPMPVEEQVVSIYLAMSGILENSDVKLVKEYEKKVLEAVRKDNPEILSDIKSTSKLSKDIEEKLKNKIKSIIG